MQATQKMKESVAYWITEREAMRKHKEAGGTWPHSKDPLMANNRYTNVHREDDKVTIWLRENWREVYCESQNLTKAMCLARMVNYIPSLVCIPFPDPWNTKEISSVLDNLVSSGGKVWSSAYMITTCGKRMNKVDYVVRHVSANCPEVTECKTLAEAYKKLRAVDGLGSFLAAQIIADLKNTQTTELGSAPDWSSWSAPGPGSLRGLSYYYEQPITSTTYHKAIKQASEDILPLLPADLRSIHMQDLQNVFCEFSKYKRGYGKNKYLGLK